jgi:hypothetical protein
VVAADDQPAERLAVVDPLGAPASLPGRFLQGVAGCGNVTAFRCGEEVQVLGGAGGQVLGQQGRSPGQQEAVAFRQSEEQPGDLRLESG